MERLTDEGFTRWNLARVVMAECHLGEVSIRWREREKSEGRVYGHLCALLGSYVWDRGVFEDTSVEELHNVEVTAYYALILTECVGFGHWDVGLLESMDDSVLAVDLVGCLYHVR